ncbi:MAG: 30S ribosomal protein S21 [Bacteriovoracaceae bacterium]|jgi:small subunit ribosomal protein S21|nr:30S ribosomal protein S21 [Bacteriovoracaceae bacterium]
MNVLIEISGDFPAEKALRKFKRKCENFGVLKEYKKRKDYKKPSVRKKEKLEQAEKRRIKTIKKNSRTSRY